MRWRGGCTVHRFGGVESIYDVHHSTVVGKGMRGKPAPLVLAEDGLFFMFLAGQLVPLCAGAVRVFAVFEGMQCCGAWRLRRVRPCLD